MAFRRSGVRVPSAPFILNYAEIIFSIAKGKIDEVLKDILKSLKDENFIRYVRFHQLGPLLYDLVPQAREHFLIDMAVSLSRWSVWDKLASILVSSPVPVVPFKGVAVGGLYPKRVHRMISDIDLWVRKRDLEELTSYLTARGIKRVMDVPNQRIFRFKGLAVEVHTSFTRFPYPSGLTEKDVLKHIKKVEGSLMMPDNDLSLSILYVHAYKSFHVKTAFKAIWWYDERLLIGEGAKLLKSSVVRKCAVWFSSVGPEDLRDRYIENDIRNRMRYLLHGFRLYVPWTGFSPK